MKLQPCITESRRHTWEHLRNVVRSRVSISGKHASATFTTIGRYRCITCAIRKDGPAANKPDVG